jgi:hypothetical protein
VATLLQATNHLHVRIPILHLNLIASTPISVALCASASSALIFNFFPPAKSFPAAMTLVLLPTPTGTRYPPTIIIYSGFPLIPPFDIFLVADDRNPVWIEPAETLEGAQARVAELGATRPGEYLVFSQKTGNKLSITIDGQ